MWGNSKAAITEGSRLTPSPSSIAQTALQRHVGLIAFALMALGTAFRLSHYAHQRALWLDEAMLALNVMDRDYAGLVGTLDSHQGAPIGFLWISKFAVNALGRNELALRLYPLLAGVAVLPLTFAVARRVAARVANHGTALVALAIVALSPALIYQSNEFKQYSSDALVTLVLILTALRIGDDPLRLKNLSALALVGVVALLLSHTTVFAAAGVGVAMITTRARAKNGREILLLSTVFGIWALAFAFLFVKFLRPLSVDPLLNDYWAFGFAPWGSGFAPGATGIFALARWPYDAFFDSLRSPGGFEFPGLAGAFALVGCIAFGYRDWRKGLFIALPVVAVAGAAAARIYPFADRVILFVVPLYAVMISVGVFFLCEGLGRARVPVVAMLLALLLLDSAQLEVRKALRPRGREEVREAMQFLAHEVQSGDLVFVYERTAPAFVYYRSVLPASLRIVLGRVYSSAETPDAFAAEVARLDGNARAWLLFSHAAKNESDFVTAFQARGKRIQERHFEGASVYLYDLSQ